MRHFGRAVDVLMKQKPSQILKLPHYACLFEINSVEIIFLPSKQG